MRKLRDDERDRRIKVIMDERKLRREKRERRVEAIFEELKNPNPKPRKRDRPRYRFTDADHAKAALNRYQFTITDRGNGGLIQGAKDMSRETQKQYMDHIMEERRKAYAISSVIDRLHIQSRQDAGIISDSQANIALLRIANTNPDNYPLPTVNDPQYWQKLPLSSAERAGFRAWRLKHEKLPETLTPDTRKKLLKEEIDKERSHPTNATHRRLLAEAYCFPSMVNDVELLEGVRFARESSV